MAKQAWRMSFRCGNQGARMWPQCLKHGVAAITYDHVERTDLSQHARGEPRELWRRLASAQQASLRRLAYEMRRGDIIYVKEGPAIVGKGVVTGRYKYDRSGSIVDPHGSKWNHHVPVRWDTGFVPVRVLLGTSQQFTVQRLTADDVARLQGTAEQRHRDLARMQVAEGRRERGEATFRRRNRAIIAAKKALSDGQCEVCGLDLRKAYGLADRDCLVAHHLEPIGRRRKASVTTIDDIMLMCPNCHAVAHTQDPPIPPVRLVSMVRR